MYNRLKLCIQVSAMRCAAVLLTLVCLTGCRLGPPYRPPDVEIPEKWKYGNDDKCIKTQSVQCHWWEIFHDDELDGLECRALLGNPSLFIAVDRIAQARAVVGIDRSALYPQLSLGPTYQATGSLFKLYLPPGATFPGTFPTIYRICQFLYTMPLNMSYEIDLWGKLRGQYESAQYELRAQEENLQTALISLTADVASAYFKIRVLDSQIALTNENIELLKHNAALASSRFTKGLAGEREVLTAGQSVTDNEALYYDLRRQRELQVNALAALLGEPPSSLSVSHRGLYSPPPEIPAGVPSTVLLQRPDVAAAERTMASQHAMIGVAYAAFFPSLELTGALGYSSPDLRQFLLWKSRLWSMGANAMQPVFTGGYNSANLNLAYAQYNERAHQYQQTVLTAFREVEDALLNIEMQASEAKSYDESAALAEKQSSLAQRRYDKGLVNYIEVIDAERNRVSSENNRINILGQQYISTIQLVKALGGSWECYTQ